MNKFIKSSLVAFTLITAIVLNGCDAFESFQFGLPISFTIDVDGTTDPTGFQFDCLDNYSTYQDYKDKLTSITFVEAHLIVIPPVSPNNIQGNATLTVRANDQSGPVLFTHNITVDNVADYISPNSYLIDLTQQQIDDINIALANNLTCFYGEYSVATSTTEQKDITLKVDILYNIEAEL